MLISPEIFELTFLHADGILIIMDHFIPILKLFLYFYNKRLLYL